jgi:hypothetical protein
MRSWPHAEPGPFCSVPACRGGGGTVLVPVLLPVRLTRHHRSRLVPGQDSTASRKLLA